MAEVVAYKPNQRGAAVAAANRLFAWLESPSSAPFPELLTAEAAKRLRQEYDADDDADLDGLLLRAADDIYDLPRVQDRIDVRMHLSGHERSLLKTAAPNLQASLNGLRLIIKSRLSQTGEAATTGIETGEALVESADEVSAAMATTALTASEITPPAPERSRRRHKGYPSLKRMFDGVFDEDVAASLPLLTAVQRVPLVEAARAIYDTHSSKPSMAPRQIARFELFLQGKNPGEVADELQDSEAAVSQSVSGIGLMLSRAPEQLQDAYIEALSISPDAPYTTKDEPDEKDLLDPELARAEAEAAALSIDDATIDNLLMDEGQPESPRRPVSLPHPTVRKHAPAETSASTAAAFRELDGDDLADVFGLPEESHWQERALCSQTDPEAFFPEKGGSTREAKKICTGCEVRGECLEYALEKDERFGIWGGLSERERRRLKRRAV